MSSAQVSLRAKVLSIWQAAVDAARPADLMRRALTDHSFQFRESLRRANRILVVGAGKAGAGMAAAIEEHFEDDLGRISGIVAVPTECMRPLRAIELIAARPAGTNQPTSAGIKAGHQVLDLFAQAGPQDVGICLWSGGGSALLPAPVESVSLVDKQELEGMIC